MKSGSKRTQHTSPTSHPNHTTLSSNRSGRLVFSEEEEEEEEESKDEPEDDSHLQVR